MAPTESASRLALFGLGGVGRAFLQLLHEGRVPVQLVAAADSRGVLMGRLDPVEVLEAKLSGGLPQGPSRDEVIEELRPHVIVDLMSCAFDTGEPSLSLIAAGLVRGAAVVTANKAPLVHAWGRLQELAASGGCMIRYSAAAGAALPAVAVAKALARADRLEAFEGVLTGTTTFVLDEVAGGASFDDAVRRAQSAGIAEPDPTIDLDGWDTAAKVVILANTIWGCDLSLEEVAVRGIDRVDRARPHGRMRLVGRARRGQGGSVHAAVAPLNVPDDHPLAGLQGRDKGVLFHGRDTGDVLVSGGRSHPRGAAAAALGDVVEVVAER
ncbi:MAG: homoserine dehydrogenase [Actinomycetota bacterium]